MPFSHEILGCRRGCRSRAGERGADLMGVGRKRQADPGSARVLLEDSPEPVLVVDAETLAFLEVNQAAIEKYGYSRDEVRQKRLTDIVPREDRVPVAEAIHKDPPGAP